MNETVIQKDVPIYDNGQVLNLRLNACRNCNHSVCSASGNSANKCNVNDLVCNLDNKKSIISKSQNLSETCPAKLWDFTNVTKKIYVPSRKSGCGCKK